MPNPVQLNVNQILTEGNFAEASYRRVVWYAKTPHTVTLEDISKPEFWANIAMRLTKGDRIEVYPEDGSFYAEFMVDKVPEKTETKPVNWARVRLMRYVDLTKTDDEKEALADLPPGFEAKFNPKTKWCVRRQSDGAMLVEKQESKREAITEFHKLKSSMAA